MTIHRTIATGIAALPGALLFAAVHSATPAHEHAAPPHLRRVAFRGGVDTMIWKPVLGIAVSRDGHVAVAADIAAPPHEGTILQILSPAADTLISTARTGQGPGELSGDDVPYGHGDAFQVRDLRRQVDVRFSARGAYLGEASAVSMHEIVLRVEGDSMDAQLIVPSTGLLAAPRRYASTVPAGRPLLPTVDTFLQRMTPAKGSTAGAPIYATGATRVAAGDARNYRIAVYDARGMFLYMIRRDLPPNVRTPAAVAALRETLSKPSIGPNGPAPMSADTRRRLDTLSREHLDFFNRAGLQFDGAGRLWVLGVVGEAVFADVFDKTTFLGRQMLPCTNPGRRIAMEGKWLALDCEWPGHDAAYVVQLYAIE